MRREISRDGLFLAFGFTLVTLGFVGCVFGLLVGPDDQAGFFAFLGGICALVLLGFGYTRLRRIDLSPTPDPPEVEGSAWSLLGRHAGRVDGRRDPREWVEPRRLDLPCDRRALSTHHVG